MIKWNRFFDLIGSCTVKIQEENNLRKCAEDWK
jgi:hypothetical protein